MWSAPRVSRTRSTEVWLRSSSARSRTWETSRMLTPPSAIVARRSARPPGVSATRVEIRTRRLARISWRLIAAASRRGSTLPPERIAAVAPSGAGLDRAGHQRRDGDRRRSLGDELRPLGEADHRLDDRLVVDGDDAVEPALEQRQRDLAGALDRDAVGDRAAPVDRDRLAGGERIGRPWRSRRPERRSPRRHGAICLIASASPAREPSPADRDDHAAQARDLLGELEADAGLPGDHVGVVEGVDEQQALVVGGRAGEPDALVDRARRRGRPRRRTTRRP